MDNRKCKNCKNYYRNDEGEQFRTDLSGLFLHVFISYENYLEPKNQKNYTFTVLLYTLMH